MNTLMVYLLESSLSVVVLYAIYWLFLRRDTFFSLNRFYLLAMLLFSLLIPLLPTWWSPSNPTAAIVVLVEPVMITPEKVDHALGAHLQWLEIASIAYFTGVIIFLLRFALQLLQLYMITRQSGIRNKQGYRIIVTDRGYSPFSFFNMVYINERRIPQSSLPTILAHEFVHIRQFHSLDMILIELAAIVQWFNPIVWLAGHEMKSIHEFLADEGVLQNGISRSTYQQMILNETMGIQVNELTNHFNVSLLKKRIAMMTKTKSKIWARSKVLFALPILLVMGFILTANSNGNLPAINPGAVIISQAMIVPAPDPTTQDKPKQETQVKYVAPVVSSNKADQEVDKMPAYPGGDEARSKFFVETVKYPENALKKGIQGTVFISFLVKADGSITNVKIMRGIGGGCDEEAIRVVKLMPKWTPGELKGKPVDVEFTMPIKFALDGDKKDAPKK